MAILTTGNTFSTGNQVTAASLNNSVNLSFFVDGAIDTATMQFVQTSPTKEQIGIKDLGVSTNKIAELAVTGAKIAETTITPTKLSAGAPAWTATTLNVANALDFAPVTTALSGTYARTLFVVTVTMTAHGMFTGNVATLAFSSGTGGTATNGAYPITVTDANTFTITDTVSGTITGTPSVSRTNYYGNATIRGSETVNGNLSVLKDASVTGALSVAGNEIRPLIRATAQNTTSGTSIDFTSIPSWVKRITVIFNGVSTTGPTQPLIRIGSSGIPVTTGYVGTAGTVTVITSTVGFPLTGYSSANANLIYGHLVITNISDNIWICGGSVSHPNDFTSVLGGFVSLLGTLDILRLTTTNGTDTFDAGSVNIMYE